MVSWIQHSFFRITLALFLAMATFGGGIFFVSPFTQKIIAPVYADDDDEEDEHEDEDEDEHRSSTKQSSSKISTKSTPIYKTVLVTKVISTLDPAFKTDQDRDGLVDGLDPHPTVHEKEYFTDDDDDSVPNAFDLHPGEDDFVYYEEESDVNSNGIIDSYESLEQR